MMKMAAFITLGELISRVDICTGDQSFTKIEVLEM